MGDRSERRPGPARDPAGEEPVRTQRLHAHVPECRRALQREAPAAHAARGPPAAEDPGSQEHGARSTRSAAKNPHRVSAPPSTMRPVTSRAPSSDTRRRRSTRREPDALAGRLQTSTPRAARRATFGCESGAAVTTSRRPGPRKTFAFSDTRSRPSTTIRHCSVDRFRPRRRVRSGSSAATVPAPTRIASYSSRSSMARRRAASPVIQRLRPEASAVFPSRLSAHFARTKGRPSTTHVRKRSFCSRRPAPPRGGRQDDSDAGPAQRREAAAGDFRIRIDRRGDHAPHSGRRDGRRARRRAAFVRAGLQCDVEIGALRGAAGPAEGQDLGVGLPRPPMERLADDAAAGDHHGADHRIGRGREPALLGERERPLEPGRINGRHRPREAPSRSRRGRTERGRRSLRRPRHRGPAVSARGKSRG